MPKVAVRNKCKEITITLYFYSVFKLMFSNSESLLQNLDILKIEQKLYEEYDLSNINNTYVQHP